MHLCHDQGIGTGHFFSLSLYWGEGGGGTHIYTQNVDLFFYLSDDVKWFNYVVEKRR